MAHSRARPGNIRITAEVPVKINELLKMLAGGAGKSVQVLAGELIQRAIDERRGLAGLVEPAARGRDAVPGGMIAAGDDLASRVRKQRLEAVDERLVLVRGRGRRLLERAIDVQEDGAQQVPGLVVDRPALLQLGVQFLQ